MALHDLKVFVMSQTPAVAIESLEEERVQEICTAVSNEIKVPFLTWSLTKGLRSPALQKSWAQSQEPRVLLETVAKMDDEGIYLLKDFHREFEDRSILRAFKDLLRQFSKSRSMVILLGRPLELPADLQGIVVNFPLQLPNEKEIGRVLKEVVSTLNKSQKIPIKIQQSELDRLVQGLKGLTRNQARQVITQAILSEGALSPSVISKVSEKKARMIQDGGLLEFFPVAEQKHELGGFEELKVWLKQAQMGFGAEARKLGLKPPKGLLLVGMPGCGKSLTARVVSEKWKLPLLKLDAGSLYNKYIGETEKNFREATRTAEAMSPSILWIDEIEKAFSTSDGGDQGLSQRLLASFLTWLQEKDEAVFVLATANQIHRLPPELMRKGRFDEIFYVDLPNTQERKIIFEIHLKRRKQTLDRFDLEELSAKSDGFTGAEIEQMIVSALYQCLYLKEELQMSHLIKQRSKTQPMSESRREEINELRNYIRGRFRPVTLPSPTVNQVTKPA